MVNNREKLKESESFVLTLQKDRASVETSKRRINVRKILNLDQVIEKPYASVTIELKNDFNLNEIKDLLSNRGETEIKLVISDKSNKATFSLQENRKFDLNHLKALKSKKYVEKIIV